jgi:hypothetical protein
MEQIQAQLLNIYNGIITELQQIDADHKAFLVEAQNWNNIPEQLVFERMALARDNQRRLQTAMIERELIESYNFQQL